jgi:hypothetical protein
MWALDRNGNRKRPGQNSKQSNSKCAPTKIWCGRRAKISIPINVCTYIGDLPPIVFTAGSPEYQQAELHAIAHLNTQYQHVVDNNEIDPYAITDVRVNARNWEVKYSSRGTLRGLHGHTFYHIYTSVRQLLPVARSRGKYIIVDGIRNEMFEVEVDSVIEAFNRYLSQWKLEPFPNCYEK